MSAPHSFTVAVDGGDLFVGQWGDRGPVVLALHGITSSHLAWSIAGEQLTAEVQLIAPDLRGRGNSSELPGP